MNHSENLKHVMLICKKNSEIIGKRELEQNMTFIWSVVYLNLIFRAAPALRL